MISTLPVQEDTPLYSDMTISRVVFCPAGSTVLNGGFALLPDPSGVRTSVLYNAANQGHGGNWNAWAVTLTVEGVTSPLNLRMTALCAYLGT